MKNSAVQTVSFVFGTVIAVAAQDLWPTFAGVKPPFVIAAVLFTAYHAPFTMALAMAFVAGLFVDALAGLPALCATSLLPLLAIGAHFLHARLGGRPSAATGACATLLAAILGEVWLAMCGIDATETGLPIRICAAAAIATPIGAHTFALLPPLGRVAGIGGTE